MKKLITSVITIVIVFILFCPIPKKVLGDAIVEYAPISRIYKVTVVDAGIVEGVQIEIFGQEVYTSADIDLD